MDTQNRQILVYLESGRTITSLEAVYKFGCMRLASRIHDLKSMGHKITKTMIELPSKKRVAQYRLEQK